MLLLEFPTTLMKIKKYVSIHTFYCLVILMIRNEPINKKNQYFTLQSAQVNILLIFQELLQRDNTVTTHQKNIQALVSYYDV